MVEIDDEYIGIIGGVGGVVSVGTVVVIDTIAVVLSLSQLGRTLLRTSFRETKYFLCMCLSSLELSFNFQNIKSDPATFLEVLKNTR